jgi:ribose-phosphate pyrophosphokinase
MAFLVAARTFREHGASHVTGVLPYLAYARQDKPTKFTREPTTAKLMADLSMEAGIDRLVTWEPHTGQIRGFYGGIPVNVLESLVLFHDEYRRFAGREDVIAVAPDAGASKMVTHFGRALDLKCAIASKYRPRAEEAEITEIIGDFSGKRTAIILDDMISSGGTVHALARRLVREKGIGEIYLAVSHNLCVGLARERLVEMHEKLGLRQAVVTDSIPATEPFRALPFVTVRGLAETFARTINRIHYSRSVSEIFRRAEIG